MEGQNQGRTLLAATLLTAALLVAMSRAVESAPFGDWWLAILLFILGVGVILIGRFGLGLGASAAEFDAEPIGEVDLALLPVGGVRTYRVSEHAPDHTAVVDAPAVNTMFIRQDRALDLDEEEASSPAVIDSGLTKPDARINLEGGEGTPSQGMPIEKGTETGTPAATPGFTARNEYSPAEAAATQEKPAEPPPATAEVEVTHDDPVKESVVEKTAAPQQSYETENAATLTPDEVNRVVNDQPSETAEKATETASEEITIHVTNPDSPVGSADDLEIIEGIGPKIAASLRDAGIDSFQKLANASEEQLRKILATASVRYPGTTLPFWAHQAAYAARQDWEGFKKYNTDRKSAGDD